MIQQTATQIFLPNLKATSAYRDVFAGCTESISLSHEPNDASQM
ncbi:putative type IV secretion system protein VirB4 [Anaplasma phagocytophilum str. ApWI1]|uniref:Type IV secretion system protein VirB4, N-terminal truncated n=3 Tax=Anaplasma phagocytophilum TaxID=948 RepID=Q2GKT1_ANAPZ|nr:type IV secretion system protein VirB4, N-terminal truncated [Anaplasma phagocytophilum str. HZ]EOA60781.1 type IV secretion system protein VirB4 [Anaplasma phagocytophilum str. HGE1]KJV60844.1 putative type IV secretion system protein VirB4 [Anaplasma phagocytophilum str. Webster]KJV66206.1 putative type IV secretion system protein VirB4 [Anaplasma phagocytophilum str. NCH-1]KJV82184.1 putative type IV secretion system protein VirB4 [Anaplasma phagocytophilum str. HGE2]KJV85076.1 putative 